jgi:Glycosyltransferase family 28 C-terminal domain
MVPSASGGIGHISRTATLARALRKLDPTIGVDYVLDAERLRPFNIDATLRMGYRPRLLPARTPESRGPLVRACFGDADVIVDDVMRFLVPLRRHVPQAAWISIAMHPISDELFMEWPHLAQMDAIIWAYPPAVGLPPELEVVADKVVQTGPFLDLDGVPERDVARARVGFEPGAPCIVYAPRGYPFGKEFGHRMVSAVFEAADTLRREGGHPRLRLVLLAVSDPAELREVEGLPAELPPWVEVLGVQTQEDTLVYQRAADILVAEGTSTIHEGAALGTPLVVVPGPIREILLLAEAMKKRRAAHVFKIKRIAPETLAEAFAAILGEPDQRHPMVDRAMAMVAGGGGVAAAARLVLEVHERRRGLPGPP